MRRLLSILLVVLFGLPLVTPLFALNEGMNSGLAACCRRDGKHHCELTMEQLSEMSQETHLIAPPEHCPAFPKAVSPAQQHHDLSFDTSVLLFGEVVSHPAVHPQTEAKARVAEDRARQKRGPPAVVLS